MIAGSIDNSRVIRSTSVFKMLSDPTRYKILTLLLRTGGVLCVNEIASIVGISQSAASHQLSDLEERGVLEHIKEGKSVCYKIKDNSFTKNLIEVLKVSL